MVVPTKIDSDLSRKINLFCLFAAIILVLLLPLKKEIWYDETITIMCSNGITHDSPTDFANTHELSSEIINSLNTPANVYKATVLDNGNSYLYNIGLHVFTSLFGYDIKMYVLFSQLCAIAALLAFFFLCNLLFKNNIFTALATLLLATDTTFMGMSHEIRGYVMGILFISLSGIYFYRFMYEKEKPEHLFFTGLFAVAAILSHFLSIYVVLVFIGCLVISKRARLLRRQNLVALLIPAAIIGSYMWGAYWGIKSMNIQNKEIQKATSEGFSVGEAFFRSLKIGAIDFKAVYPSFRDNRMAITGSFLLVLILYITAIWAAESRDAKRKLHLLFLSGISATLFLAVLCLRAHHYTALYHRYHSFSLPFTTLFVAYALYLIYSNYRLHNLIKAGFFALFLLPSLWLYSSANVHNNPKRVYNHTLVAQQILQYKITKIEVPEWKDAFLINCLLPKSYEVDYVRNETSPYFTLFIGNTATQLPVINNTP